MKLDITVTQKNIDDSRPFVKCKCPIALAIEDQLIPLTGLPRERARVYASVDHKEARCDLNGDMNKPAYFFPLPREAEQFIADRDSGKAVKPFSFSVTAKPYRPECQLTIMRKEFGFSVA